MSPFSGVAAFGVARVTTIGMTDALMHCQHGFFNEPGGVRTGEGTEYHLLAAGLALVLIIRGGGSRVLDSLIAVGRPISAPASRFHNACDT